MKDIDVEDLLTWVFRDQRADLYIGNVGLHAMERAAEGERVQASAGGVNSFEAIAAMGCRVDGGGGGGASGMAIDGDAAHVAEFVAWLKEPMRGLLIRHGRAGSRPNWGQDLVTTRIRPAAGTYSHPLVEPMWDYDGQPGRGRQACPIEYIDYARSIERLREAWTLWRDGLVLVAYAMRQEFNRLKDHRVRLPGVVREPWA